MLISTTMHTSTIKDQFCSSVKVLRDNEELSAELISELELEAESKKKKKDKKDRSKSKKSSKLPKEKKIKEKKLFTIKKKPHSSSK